ncbi:hypothetical protein BH23PLA1_BH23PLA1_20520 [soil metagenome]
MVFEEGDLRQICLGEVEVLRRIYVAVRDRNWGTVPGLLSDLRVEAHVDSFSITFLNEHRQGEIDFLWRGSIEGDNTGKISFSMQGEARSTFLRNRIGFCVLHPIRECAGRPCLVETIADEVVEGRFPARISPHQPFQGMRAISHEVGQGVWAEVRFAGETFEMEDQRNWTDASFKTYGTPLELPFPVEITAGTRIEQTVTLRLIEPKAGKPVTVSVWPSPARPLPAIGLGIGNLDRPLSQREADRLRLLNLGHLRVDLDLTRPKPASTLARASGRAIELGTSLEVALFVSDDAEAELANLAKAVKAIQPRVARCLVFHVAEKATTERWVLLAREHLAPEWPGVPIGAGTNAYFAELNRGYPSVPPVDFVCYSINPQVHAFDDFSMIETLEAQPETVQSARNLSGGLPVVVSPITLRPRFNPNATGADPEPSPGELPATVDPRQASLLGACWTLGSLAALIGDGVDARASSLTYYETIGWRGVMESDDGPPLPDRFAAGPGEVFPMYHVFADVGEFSGGSVLSAQSFDPIGLTGLALANADGDRLRVLLANLGAEARFLSVFGLGTMARVRLLDETNAEQAMRSPEDFRADPGTELTTSNGSLTLELHPFALARIDSPRPEDEAPEDVL